MGANVHIWALISIIELLWAFMGIYEHKWSENEVKVSINVITDFTVITVIIILIIVILIINLVKRLN